MKLLLLLESLSFYSANTIRDLLQLAKLVLCQICNLQQFDEFLKADSDLSMYRSDLTDFAALLEYSNLIVSQICTYAVTI